MTKDPLPFPRFLGTHVGPYWHCLQRMIQRFATYLERQASDHLAPPLLKERSLEDLHASDLRTARYWDALVNIERAAWALCCLLLFLAPIFFIIDGAILTPLATDTVPDTPTRIFAALSTVLLIMGAIGEGRSLSNALGAVKHGSLSTDTALDVHLTLAEARAFETGNGRIRSEHAACERYLKVLSMPPPEELSSHYLPPPLIAAIHGALRTSRAFLHPTKRYESFAKILSLHRQRLMKHRVVADVCEHLLADYIAAARSDYPCGAGALVTCSNLAQPFFSKDPIHRERLASIALRHGHMLPEHLDLERTHTFLSAFTLLDPTDAVHAEVEQLLLNEVVNLSDTLQRSLLTSHLLESHKLSEGAQTVLEGLLMQNAKGTPRSLNLQYPQPTETAPDVTALPMAA